MTPPILTTRDIVERIVTVHAKGRTLDIGAGSAKYRHTIVAGTVTDYQACDIKSGPHVDSVQDIHHLTFADASFDTVLSFQVFEQVYVMSDGGPAYATTVLGLFIYLNAFRYNNMGYAAAAAYVLFAIIAVITMAQFRLQGRWTNYEL